MIGPTHRIILHWEVIITVQLDVLFHIYVFILRKPMVQRYNNTFKKITNIYNIYIYIYIYIYMYKLRREATKD